MDHRQAAHLRTVTLALEVIQDASLDCPVYSGRIFGWRDLIHLQIGTET